VIDGLTTGEIAITLAAILAVVAAWTLYVRRRLTDRGRRSLAGMADPEATPPERAVPVDSALVERLYALQDWDEIRALLTDDFVLRGPNGTQAGLEELRRTNELMAGAYEELHATVEAVLADLEHPSVLYVRDHSRGRAQKGPDLDITAWTRVVVAANGTRIRELGPTSVIHDA
jgi:hypothetical protein